MNRLNTLQQQSPLATSAVALLCLSILLGTTFLLTLAVHFESTLAQLPGLVTLLWLSSYVWALLGLLNRFGINWLTWLVRYRLPLVVLTSGAVLSGLWSVDAGLTLERCVHLVGSTLIAIYIGFSLPLVSLLRVTARVLAVIIVLSMLAALFYPAIGLEDYEGRQVWSGVLPSKNTLGFWSAIALMLFGTLAAWNPELRQRLPWLILMVLAGICLVSSVSATSLLSLIIAGLAMLFLYATARLSLPPVATLLLATLCGALALLAFQSIDTAELIGRSGDLTGRSDVWSETWKLILKRPMTGFGYGTVWFPTNDSLAIQQSLMELSWTVYHAHNGLLHVASEIGLPLTIITVLWCVSLLCEITQVHYHRPQAGVIMVAGFTVALLVSNYSEARLLVNRDLAWIFLIALPISLLQQVTVTANQSSAHTPIRPLPPRILAKLDTGALLRARRRALKARMRSRANRLKRLEAASPPAEQFGERS